MKERPILLNAEMARAVLNGRKTQTRRVIKPQPVDYDECGPYRQVPINAGNGLTFMGRKHIECPYGKVGDHLWVRETWATIHHYDHLAPRDIPRGDARWPQTYMKAWTGAARDSNNRGKWRPSIFMPRWASRITLEVTGVRVQLLQDITEDDAAAEGIERHSGPYILDFAKLWDSINAKRGYSWANNPWVWIVEFQKVEDDL